MKYLLLPSILLSLSLTLSAQTVPTPTQTDAIIIDNGAAGKADPNDRIRYNVTIQNTGGAPATGVQLNAVPDPRTTLVPGSFKTSPIAANDAYTSTGNVGIIVPAAIGVKVNDYDDAIGVTTLSCGTCLSAQNGTVVLNNDGSFTYTPAAGFTGSDNFTYTITDGNPAGAPAPLTDVATVTITVSNLIWFIDNSAAAGDGRRNTPFNSLAAFNAGSAAAGDIVYIKNTGTTYTGGIVLQANERLFGEGHTGGANLADVLNFTLAPNSVALPAINGSRPVITNASGNGVTLATNNAIRGIDVGATSGAKISGTSFGTLTVGNTTTPDVLLNSTGQALNLATGTFAATSKFISVTTTSSGTQGILLAGIAGTVAFGSTSVSGNTTQGILVGTSTANIDFGNTTVSAGTDGVSLQNNSAGTRTFSTLTISGNSAVGFLHGAGGGTTTVTGATTITNPGGIGIDIQNSATTVTFAGTTVNKGSSAGAGVNLGGAASGNSGNTTFNSLAITTSNGAGLVGTNNAGQINVTTNAGSISAASGAAINISRAAGGNTPVTLNFINVGTTSSPTNGVAFTNVSGSYTASGGTLTNCSGTAFLVSAGTLDITSGGTISGNSALAVDIDNHDSGNITFQTGNITSTTQGIRVQNSNGGTIAFNNPSKSLNTGANTAVNLLNNGGATINFGSGGLVTTTTG
ncbi:MAG: Ig-like domain-containing protein, partial [Saprospiraceae bacterium]